MNYTKNTTNIFTRYDLKTEAIRQQARRVSEDEILQRVVECLIVGDEEEIENAVDKALMKRDPEEIIQKGLISGMKEVSRLWDEGFYFLPQVIISSDAMIAGISICEKKMGKPVQKKATVVTHTAEGDIHDIGQVIVNALLSAAGFQVINLGPDVPVEKVIEACKIHNPVMVTGTALMTTTMTAFPRIAAGLKQAGINIPFVCGGGAVSEEFITSFDQGIWGKEASMAPIMAQDALNGLSWIEMKTKWNG